MDGRRVNGGMHEIPITRNERLPMRSVIASTRGGGEREIGVLRGYIE